MHWLVVVGSSGYEWVGVRREGGLRVGRTGQGQGVRKGFAVGEVGFLAKQARRREWRKVGGSKSLRKIVQVVGVVQAVIADDVYASICMLTIGMLMDIDQDLTKL